MNQPLIPYLWNRSTSVVKQGKYRISMKSGDPVIEVVIETSDDMRIYPATTGHPKLVSMVNSVKKAAGFHEGGQFSINEFRQVIVPATNSLGDGELGYYYAGEYYRDIVLRLDQEEFSGRPVDSSGRMMKLGDSWSGRPRPGICYKLKAGAADVEFLVKISPGREKIYRLSKFVSTAEARRTAGKIAQVKGHKGGRFFINEYRAMFCPLHEDDFTDWKFIGLLEEADPWFPKWSPESISSPAPLPARGATPALLRADPRQVVPAADSKEAAEDDDFLQI